ncbi:MAG: hypothetical protein E7168_03610 [Firmicutes bacterium]|nr:hypothetical protein [Bacillota bacterium]
MKLEKRIIGVIENQTSRTVKANESAIFMAPVYFDGIDYYIKYASSDFGNLLKILVQLDTSKEREEEIYAYLNKENSLFSNKQLKYSGDSNFYYKKCSKSIVDDLDFYSLSEFNNIDIEKISHNYRDYTYAVTTVDKNLIIGDISYIKERLNYQRKDSILKLSKIDFLIQEVNYLTKKYQFQ